MILGKFFRSENPGTITECKLGLSTRHSNATGKQGLTDSPGHGKIPLVGRSKHIPNCVLQTPSKPEQFDVVTKYQSSKHKTGPFCLIFALLTRNHTEPGFCGKHRSSVNVECAAVLSPSPATGGFSMSQEALSLNE